MNAKVKVGDRVTCMSACSPYSRTAKGYDNRMFEPGAVGEVVALPASVFDSPCVECGKRHKTFVCVEFEWADGTGDRVSLSPCNVQNIGRDKR